MTGASGTSTVGMGSGACVSFSGSMVAPCGGRCVPSVAFYSTATTEVQPGVQIVPIFSCGSLTQRASRMILTLPALPERSREELVRLRVKVFYHDKCFDGACSASLFTRFHR